MFEAVFSPIIYGVFGDLYQSLVILFRFHFHEGHHHGTHQITDFERAFTAHQHRHTSVSSWRESLGHHVNTVHTAHTVAIVDFQ